MSLSEIDKISFLQRIKDLKRKYLDSVNYTDLNYRGVYFDDDEPKVAVNRELALKNIIQIWLLSKPGDYYRELGKGGVIHEFLATPLSEEYRLQLENLIETKFNEDIFYAQLNSVEVIPNVELRVWTIKLDITDLISQSRFSFGVNLQV